MLITRCAAAARVRGQRQRLLFTAAGIAADACRAAAQPLGAVLGSNRHIASVEKAAAQTWLRGKVHQLQRSAGAS
jgi:hypothetical protein